MKNKTRRTEITIETHRLTIIRTRGKELRVNCHRCRNSVKALTFPQTASLLNLSVESIDSLLAADRLHLIEFSENDYLPLVCSNSPGLNQGSQIKPLP